jgi:beta-galactosidase
MRFQAFLIRSAFIFAFVPVPLVAQQPTKSAQETDIAAVAPRQRLLADFGWKFTTADPTNAASAAFDDSGWRTVNLPHDWSIEGPFSEVAATGGPGGYLPTGIGWYRRHFTAPESWRGQKVTIEFEGVYQNSDVWINGQHLGKWPYGYTSFYYDLTPHLKFGQEPNVIAVRVDNSAQPNSRWYSGSGIYRPVWLTATGPLHVAHWGTYVTTPNVTTNTATVRIRTRIQNESSHAETVILVSQVVDTNDQVVATAESAMNIPAIRGVGFYQLAEVANPRLWSPDAPNLYRVHTIVRRDRRPADEYDTPFGIRDIQYDVNRGFLLNGEPVKMLGMCLHHDGGSVGAAVPAGVLERRLRLLKEMGCNAVRCSHNPMSPEFYDLCDRLGLLVMDEAFDEWTRRKPQIQHGYSDWFADWYERDLINLIHRDRNHPCVVMWSAGNEIGEQLAPNGHEVLQKLVDAFHREDPTRPVTAACDNVFTDTRELPAAFANLLDIVGYNYVDRWVTRRETFFADDRVKYPNRKMVGTEDSGLGGVRGRYDIAPTGTNVSARPRYASSMIRAEQLWKFNRMHDYVIGYFTWTGIDYLGESRWPNKNSSSGVLDTCGFPKDGYYFYQSQWSAKPVLHLFPHWNWPGREGQVVPVIAYSNCDVVELFLNGKSFGAKALEFPRQGAAGGWNRYARPQVFPTTADLHLAWDVPYEPGTLKAVGYKDGREVCTTEISTTGEPAKIGLSVDKNTVMADGRDVAHVRVQVLDADGRVVPTADNEVAFEIQGAGRIIGVDNGNPASHEDYKANHRKVFNGLCLAVVQAAREPGKIRLVARAERLEEASIEIESQATAMPATLP